LAGAAGQKGESETESQRRTLTSSASSEKIGANHHFATFDPAAQNVWIARDGTAISPAEPADPVN
jgi:hypothetical protein